jgi:DNA-directed RNA polymerase subunit RPC12/RpoP
VVKAPTQRRVLRAPTPDRQRQRRRIFRFSLNCFSCGHEAGAADSIEELKIARCARCDGRVFVERDAATPVYVEDRRLRR